MKKMMPFNRYPLVSETGRDVFAGRQAGDSDWARLAQFAERTAEGSLLVVDLQGVQFLAASYFAAAFLPLWSTGLALRREIYPVLEGVRASVRDEVAFVIEGSGGLIWVAAGAIDDPVDPVAVGSLDKFNQLALDTVHKQGVVAAVDLFALDTTIPANAWSNRLNQLYTRRVLQREKSGKRWLYRAPWEIGHG